MSSFAVTVERVTVLPHPNADALELARVGGEYGYRAVVRKGQFTTGDYALYIPEQAILPDGLIEEFGLVGRLSGSGKNRVKAVRLRGEVSQGLVVLPTALTGVDLVQAEVERTDFAEVLGIEKWVPEVPSSMSGLAMGTMKMLKWVDIENLRKADFQNVFTEDEMVSATEKLHGTCFVSSLVIEKDESDFLVTSKGQGERHLALVEDEKNIYWRAARAYDVEGFARWINERVHGFYSRVGIFGEVYGLNIQDLGYGAAGKSDKPGFAIFDIQVQEHDGEHYWLNQDVVRDLADEYGMPMVPELYRGPFSFATLAALAEGKETISGTEANVREGLVVRPVRERYSDVTAGRAIGKIVGEGYALRKNGTEYN